MQDISHTTHTHTHTHIYIYIYIPWISSSDGLMMTHQSKHVAVSIILCNKLLCLTETCILCELRIWKHQLLPYRSGWPVIGRKTDTFHTSCLPRRTLHLVLYINYYMWLATFRAYVLHENMWHHHHKIPFSINDLWDERGKETTCKTYA